MSTHPIRGVIVPIVTPLTPDEDVDFASLRRLVNHLIDNGVHGIWAAGTTGEFAALTAGQQVAVIETVAEEVAGRVPVIANISAAGTKQAVEMGLSVREMGVDGVAATPPYYYPCAQDELLAHFRRIRERVGMALWVYNIPVMVKTVVEPATIAQLGSEGTVVGVKDSSGAGELLAQLTVLCGQGGIEMLRFLGTVYRITITRAIGAHGVIPGIANLAPGIVSKAWEAGEAGDIVKAREYEERILAAMGIMRLAGGGGADGARFSGTKSALKVMGVIEHDTVSSPLRPLTEEEKRPIPAMLRELGLLSSNA